uniref:C-type lectin domain-containing protein n=1 Tax=Periophthalmus magnuspinnatus TaxID=409849 RepID=A0A3B4B766_9GOBI
MHLFFFRASEMRGLATLVLVLCSRFPLRQYHFINTPMTWPQAQQYCRQNYTDLATFESIEEVQQFQPTISFTWVWIGLFDDMSSWQGVMGKEPNSWRWSATGDHSQSGYQIWSFGEPNYGDRFETCVVMDTNGEWQDKGCNLLYGFVCFTGKRTQGLVNSEYYIVPLLSGLRKIKY